MNTSSIVEYVQGKQAEDRTVLIHFKNSSPVYITPESTIKKVLDDFIQIKSDVSIKGTIDAIFNVNDIARLSMVHKKMED